MVRTVLRKSREMAGERRDEEHARLGRIDVLLEAQQRPERCREHGVLTHRHLAIADLDVVDSKRRPVVSQPRPRNELVRGGKISKHDIVGNAHPSSADDLESPARPGANRNHDVRMGLVGLVEHSPKSPAVERRSWASDAFRTAKG